MTAATLRLFPRPQQRLVALLSTADARSMLQLFVRVRDRFDTELTAFEFMSAEAVTMACQHLQKTHPLPDATGCCVLLELASLQPGETLNDALLDCLEKASEDGLVDEAAMATSQRQADLFWSVRESVPVAMLQNFPRCSPHDISVPISKIPDFIDQMQTMTASRWPQLESLVFGHVGDGNLHWNFLAQEALAPSQFAELASEATLCLYEHTVAYGGSISAEHGIGLHKKALLERFAPEGQLRLMRALKGALDGSGVMNPGKIF
ncbi:FAD-binding oxidoreductase [Hydrogenophaga pseudoflava]|uniref:FAD-binding oxidoreductase n=1 Tax=Hydrogenophaga pseudoflava TaxID=47421 RepID=UPI0027E5673C|nr:FAD-binding oxidoreductase [Hydrogenophaga pseudoflava]MDQ7744153.1 FAD-binding oxidoreductase [Hydrogenophaga pseudoflava]